MMNQVGFTSGALTGPADGKVAWTMHDDLAAVDALLLAGKAQFDGPTPPLTGDAALDLADLAALATDLLGRSIVRKVVTQEVMASALRSSGMPESTVQIVLGYFHAAEAGEFATVDPTLAHLLGRPAATLRSYLETKLQNTSRQLR
ncbi:hypothetical protein [Stenotrophomonas tumulicola]|uniref:NmrA family transcriptional regulator n=1 Tax=Stenotrophomonas tumulicola TaxID=1685415 RepID=A0A7W3FK15_9GAMM|nr:hypothetical protein [Stenotrophomonas tumulicola]MBA8680994.1 hypothetical protein [Stenotrophomonas tumulicola]